MPRTEHRRRAVNADLRQLSPYQLAMLFRDLATLRCRSWEEDADRQADLEAVGAEMDRRDVRLEDWDVHNHHS